MKRSDFCVDFASIRTIDKDLANLYWLVLDQIAFMPWPQSKSELRKALRIAPEGVRRFYLTGTIEGPIENGGLGQYFACPRPLHRRAKAAISRFGASEMVKIVNEAERYLELNKAKLRAQMPWDEWVKVMGVVPMNKALNDVHRRFLRASGKLDDAKEAYLRKHPERLGPVPDGFFKRDRNRDRH